MIGDSWSQDLYINLDLSEGGCTLAAWLFHQGLPESSRKIGSRQLEKSLGAVDDLGLLSTWPSFKHFIVLCCLHGWSIQVVSSTQSAGEVLISWDRHVPYPLRVRNLLATLTWFSQPVKAIVQDVTAVAFRPLLWAAVELGVRWRLMSYPGNVNDKLSQPEVLPLPETPHTSLYSACHVIQYIHIVAQKQVIDELKHPLV